MKLLLTITRNLLALVGYLALLSAAHGQGYIHFANSSGTLISAEGTPTPISGVQQFIFAIFLGSSMIANTTNQTALFTDPAFQIPSGYTTNSSSLEGRITTRLDLAVAYQPGSTVDFIVRSWSANAGATWTEALANWNKGVPVVPMFIGTSTIGNDYVIGGVFAIPFVFGIGPHQVSGFNMTLVPEPSPVALGALGTVVFLLFSLSFRRASN